MKAQLVLPNMMVEDADLPAWWHRHSVKKFRRNALDPVPQVQKLGFSFRRQHASGAGKMIHRPLISQSTTLALSSIIVNSNVILMAS